MDSVRVAYTLEQCWHRVPGGTAVAALEVARAMPNVRPDVELLGVSGTHRDDPTVDFDLSIDVAGLPLKRPALYETSLRFRWPRVESVWTDLDLVHCTTIIPFATKRPLVVTVHDLANLRHPEFFTKRGNSVFHRSLRAVRKRADLVIVSSRATLEDCVAAGLDRDKLRHVPLGVRMVEPTADESSRTLTTLGVPSSFILFVGTIEPRKNLARLIETVTSDPTLPPLVVAGASGWGNAVDSADANRVHFVGHVDDGALRVLYRSAMAFVYPSLWEGFGLPILEAMAQGTPVVTSRGTSTEEVAGGAAVLVDPTTTSSIGDGIAEALRHRDEWAARSRARAAEMTWDSTARATAAVYDEVIAR